MSDTPEKKNDHPIFVNVVSGVLIGVILLVCTTIYNLFLAHIWPVTIHFGEYSLNNIIFVAVSIVSSVLLAVIILTLEILFVFNSFIRAINNIGIPREKRKKRQWFERILETFLMLALVMANALIRFATREKRKEIEEKRKVLVSLPLRPEQKLEQKQEHVKQNRKEE